ncbi:hypothetical protein [Tuwongella immobilis]|uniref:Uncharacterized protein n=1 Tax=Tuwongella immobilis TaxID=692036 RepID=A0A6C2YTM2_9BACT|nr:hypothetical protein [Tuwongella immobilis]VIP04826.1 unnamed protein product [Tuwongella immobilis]VTS07012.1 unnamed protein product [Tuwongella immobilis]
MKIRLIVPAIALASAILILSDSATHAQDDVGQIVDYRDFKRHNDYYPIAQIEVEKINQRRIDFYDRLAKGGNGNNQETIIRELLARYRQISPDYRPYRADPNYGFRPRIVTIDFPRPPAVGPIPTPTRRYELRTKAEFDAVIEERRKILDTIAKINRFGGDDNRPADIAWALAIPTLQIRFDHLNDVLDDAVAFPPLVTLIESRRDNVFEASSLRLEAGRISRTLESLRSATPVDID